MIINKLVDHIIESFIVMHSNKLREMFKDIFIPKKGVQDILFGGLKLFCSCKVALIGKFIEKICLFFTIKYLL